MAKKRVIIFGNVAIVPENAAEAVQINVECEGISGPIHTGKEYYLKAAFLLGQIRIEEKFLIAREINFGCAGSPEWFNKDIFKTLEAEGFPEEQKTELSGFLMDRYYTGEVKKEAMMNKFKELLGLER